MTLSESLKQVVEVVFLSVREDDPILQEIVKYLGAPRLKPLIHVWSRLDIKPGEIAEIEMMAHLEIAHIILILVSPDFVASPCCAGKEIERCMQRRQEDARVIPLI